MSDSAAIEPIAGAAIALVALALLRQKRVRVAEPAIVAGAAAAGLVLHN